MVTSTVRSDASEQAFRTIARRCLTNSRQFAIVCSELTWEDLGGLSKDCITERKWPRYGMFAVTRVQLKSGGSLTETLQTLGETVSQRVALAARTSPGGGGHLFVTRTFSFARGYRWAAILDQSAISRSALL